jgi:HlyD family secretion protein
MKKLLLLLVLVMLFLAAAAYWLGGSRNSSDPSFTVATVEHGPLVETVSATGVLQPIEVIPVGTEVSGTVVEVAADFNQVVTEGDPLFRLDDRVPQRKLKQAEVGIDLAVKEVERSRALRDAAQKTVDKLRPLPESVGLRKELDAAEAQLRAGDALVEVSAEKVREAEEARNLANLGVRLTRVHVPFVTRPSPDSPTQRGLGAVAHDGAGSEARRKFLVLDRKVEVNQFIGPPASAHVFTLAGDLARMQVHAQVAEGDIGLVRRGQRADFTLATAADDVLFTGRVVDLRLMPVSDHGAIYYKVVIDVANKKLPDAPDTPDVSPTDWQLRPGMTVSVDVVAREHPRAWKVPLAALNLEMPEEYVTPAARAKLAKWQGSAARHDWQPVWTVTADGQAWPVLVRTGGVDARNETGIRDAQHCEALEWEADLGPRPEPSSPATYPQVITAAPPPKQGGLFTLPKVKI